MQRSHFALSPVQASVAGGLQRRPAAPAPSPRCSPGIDAMLATCHRPLNSSKLATASVLERIRAEPTGPGRTHPRCREALPSSQAQPTARLTSVLLPGLRHGQQLRQRQKQDQQAGFPGPHHGGGSVASRCQLLKSYPGPGGLVWRSKRENQKQPPQEVLAGDWLGAREAEGRPIPARSGTRAACALLRVRVQSHRPPPQPPPRAPRLERLKL